MVNRLVHYLAQPCFRKGFSHNSDADRLGFRGDFCSSTNTQGIAAVFDQMTSSVQLYLLEVVAEQRGRPSDQKDLVSHSSKRVW